MYQEFFQLDTLPFSLSSNPNFFCELKNFQQLLNSLQLHLQNDEGHISIIGEAGSGKTILCRKLIEDLDKNYLAIYITTPHSNPIELCNIIAEKIGLDIKYHQNQKDYLANLHQYLLSTHTQGKKIILLIDEAQMLSDETFEIVRFLAAFKTRNKKLLQILFFGQPYLDKRLNQANINPIKQHIQFTYKLSAMNRNELDVYLHHRLSKAGYTNNDPLFTNKAKNLLFKASRGIPQIINVIAHKALLVAFGKGNQSVNHKAMRMAITDTEIAKKSKLGLLILAILILVSLPILFLLIVIMIGDYL